MKLIEPNLGIDIISHGRYIPDNNIYTNIDIINKHPYFEKYTPEKKVMLADKIHQDFGFFKRSLIHFPGSPFLSNELTSEDLAMMVLGKAKLKNSEWLPEMLIHGSTTSSKYTGSQAATLSGFFKSHIPTIETKAGCSTSLMSLHMTWSFLNSHYSKIALVVAETLSKIIDPSSLDDWFGLADGAACLFIEKNNSNPMFKVIKSAYYTKGEYAHLYTTKVKMPPQVESIESGDFFLKGDIQSLREQALTGYEELINMLLPTSEDRKSISLIIPHQADKNTINEIKNKFQISGQVHWDADNTGNIGGSSIIYSLSSVLDSNILKRGERILFLSVGGGLSVAGQVWEVGNR